MIELTIRLVFSLALVVGLLLVVVRVGGRRFRSSTGAPVRVLHRQALTRTSGVAVLEVGGRVLVLGTTEHQVSMLAELDPSELATSADVEGADAASEEEEGSSVGDVPAEGSTPAEGETVDDGFADHVDAAVRELSVVRDEAAPAAAPRAIRTTPSREDAAGPLAGSVLSADTWRQAVAAARGRK